MIGSCREPNTHNIPSVWSQQKRKASRKVDLYDPLKRPSRPSFDGPLLEEKNGRRDGHGTRSTGAINTQSGPDSTASSPRPDVGGSVRERTKRDRREANEAMREWKQKGKDGRKQGMGRHSLRRPRKGRQMPAAPEEGYTCGAATPQPTPIQTQLRINLDSPPPKPQTLPNKPPHSPASKAHHLALLGDPPPSR
ncbi:hypothetical protein DFH09DRAFT_1283500 [Mycena vulgaris]|nr:hypothetical protein DFH09DRAFT_1283500 [Mycena vulgaris]